MRQISMFMVILFPLVVFSGHKISVFTDNRDGKLYKTVVINGTVWMAENFAYETSGSCIYDNDPVNEKKFGRLYTWEAAVNNCPRGWRLPSDKDWKSLEKHLGIKIKERNITGYRNFGKPEKYRKLLEELNFLFSGCRKHESGDFLGLNSFGFYWTSTPYKDIYAWKRAIDTDEPGIGRHTHNKKNFNAVRYIRNRN